MMVCGTTGPASMIHGKLSVRTRVGFSGVTLEKMKKREGGASRGG